MRPHEMTTIKSKSNTTMKVCEQQIHCFEKAKVRKERDQQVKKMEATRTDPRDAVHYGKNSRR